MRQRERRLRRTWSPTRGKELSIISTVINQGKTNWMIIVGNFNHPRLIEFFEALIKHAGRKVILVLDNLGVHHCKPVNE
jgi:hypothetical protein